MTDKESNGKKTDYRALRSELDDILLELQEGNLDIDKALEKYKRGQEIVTQLQKFLTEAENQVLKLKTQFSSDKKQ